VTPLRFDKAEKTFAQNEAILQLAILS
jgi:hypothetical protein